jgi:hypothetical protein
MKIRSLKVSAMLLALVALSTGTAFAASASLAPAEDRAPARLFVPQVAAPSVEARAALDEILYQYDVVELPLARLAREVRTTGRLDIVLAGQRFEIDVALNDLRAPGYREVVMEEAGPVENPARPISTYAGHLVGGQEGTVRLTANRGLFTGYVRTADDWVFVDPLREFVPNAPKNAAVVYREADVRPEASGLCGVTHRLKVGGEQGIGLPPGLIGKNHTTLRTLQVATEADGQYYQAYGNPGLFNRIQGILNDVDGIYEDEINLSISITYQQAWPSVGGDPYTSLDAVTTLNQFRSWWNANRGGTTRDTAHMFSGKDFNGGTIGIAWVGVICNSATLSYGISQDFGNSSQRAALTAHEIGHNLDADHDTSGCASCNGFGPIMCPSIQSNGALQFSSCSINQINTHTHNNGSCLN